MPVLNTFYLGSTAIDRAALGTTVLDFAPPVQSPVGAVAANGWQVTYARPPAAFAPDTAPQTLRVTRQGFDATGAAARLDDTLMLTSRLRQPYPDQNRLTADQVVLSDYIYGADTVAGTINNSTAVSPEPLARWGLPDKQTVGDSIDIEVIAFHRDARDGRPVAAVVVEASDGTNTVTRTVSEMTLSGYAFDANPVPVYATTLNISSLQDRALITVNARVYPNFGIADSVLDSRDKLLRAEFSPRYYRRDTDLAAAPLIAVVNPSHPNAKGTTGAISSDPAVARATPWTTIHGPIRYGLHNVGIPTDGVEIWLAEDYANATSIGASGGEKLQEISCITLTRDPDVARENARLLVMQGAPSLGISSSQTGTGMLRIRDLDVRRTGLITGGNQEILFENCRIDANGQANPFNSASGLMFGCEVVNVAANVGFFDGAWQTLRGNTCANANGSKWYTGATFGNVFTDPGRGLPSGGAVTAYNAFFGMTTDNFGAVWSNSTTTGQAAVQNVFEIINGNWDAVFRLSGDGSDENTQHTILWHNTVGGGSGSRCNMFYDETVDPVVRRFHELMSVKGNIFHTIRATKGDVFRVDGTRQGNWPYSFGVGSHGNIDCFLTGFPRDFLGLNSISATVRASAHDAGTYPSEYQDPDTYVDPLFVRDGMAGSGSVTGEGGLGVGNGDYAVTAGSPAIGRGPRILPFDLAGNPRGPDSTIGAFEYRP